MRSFWWPDWWLWWPVCCGWLIGGLDGLVDHWPMVTMFFDFRRRRFLGGRGFLLGFGSHALCGGCW